MLKVNQISGRKIVLENGNSVWLGTSKESPDNWFLVLHNTEENKDTKFALSKEAFNALNILKKEIESGTSAQWQVVTEVE